MTSIADLQQGSPEKTSDLILIVEDDEATREFLTICITSETSCRVLAVASGVEALQRVEEIIKARPSLFILDFHLPNMNGLQLYDRLHGLKEFEHVPTIILTASTLDEQMQSTIAERGVETLLKPFDLDDLLRCIEEILMRSTQLT